MKRRVLALLVLPLFFTPAIEAQILTGRLLGVVRDGTNAVLPGVIITASSPARPGGPVTVVTNERGEYRLTELPPGTYALTAALSGFSRYEETGLQVSVGGTVERNISLSVSTVEETITVSGETPMVDPRQAGIVKSMPVEVAEVLPHNRQGGAMVYMATLPGVTASNYNRVDNLVVMGSNTNETSYMSDGILTNSIIGGATFAYMDGDQIQEVNMVTLGASAEYQQAQGGVLNVVNKSGTNTWRGDGLYYWAPSGLVSAPIALPCNCPLGETGYHLYKYRDYAFHAGGPIKRDRLWYYGGMTNYGPSARLPGAPETPEAYRYTEDTYRSNQKITLKINDRMNFQQVIQYEWWGWSSPSFPTQTNPLETLQWFPGDIRGSATEVTATLSPSTVMTGRYTIYSMPFGFIGFGPDYNKSDLSTPARTDLFTGVNSVNNAAQAYQPRRDEVAFKLNQDFSGSRVNHNVRYGAQIVYQRNFRQDIQPGNVLYQDFNGAPFQAVFSQPSTDAQQYRGQGFWAEDEITIGQRLTIVPSVRFDRMAGSIPPAPVVNATQADGDGGLCRCVLSFPTTGQTVSGQEDLFTWTEVSPRIGLNVRLTNDGKSILRATAGRYYRPIILNEFSGLHGGVSTTTLAAYDAATGRYSNILSVTDPRANIAFDPDIRAPLTDQFSIGIDRELTKNVGFSVSYVHKRSEDQISWRDIGGAYGTQTVMAPNGQPLTVFPLQSSAISRRYLRTNGDGYFTRYNGLILGVTKRYTNRWTASAGYSFSKAEGLQPGGNTGRDPNDLINLTGELDGNDRPHIFNSSAAYEIPRITVQVSGNLTLVSGRPYGAQTQVRLPQGLRNIYFEAPGSYRRPSQQWLDFRASKILFRHAARYVELGVEVRNVLQEDSIDSLITQVAASPNFGQPSSYAVPRRMMFRVKGFF